MGFMDSFKSKQAEPGKRPGLMVAIGLGKPHEEPDGDEGGELDEGEMAAAHAAMAAVQGGDVEAFGRAMKAFVSACGEGGEGAEGEGEEDEEPEQGMPGMMRGMPK